MLAACRASRCIVSFLVCGSFVIGVASAVAVGLIPRVLRADTITLRGGGQVEGKVVPDPKDKDKVQVWLLKGRKPLSIPKGQILEVVAKPTALDDYFEKKKKAAETAAGPV